MPGSDLIDAIKSNAKLMGYGNCTGVSVQLGNAMYGSEQNDGDNIAVTAQNVAQQIIFDGDPATQTTLWHFLVIGKNNEQKTRIHHFCVVPWFKANTLTYTVFMAYEKVYNVGQYVRGEALGDLGNGGYREEWSAAQVTKMIELLFSNKKAWGYFFMKNAEVTVESITLWKYGKVAIDEAIPRVEAYGT